MIGVIAALQEDQRKSSESKSSDAVRENKPAKSQVYDLLPEDIVITRKYSPDREDLPLSMFSGINVERHITTVDRTQKVKPSAYSNVDHSQNTESDFKKGSFPKKAETSHGAVERSASSSNSQLYGDTDERIR